MAPRSHLSIGEVLSLLREEFPDITISKIRFLESQGLVDPERTPSGYRKFYEHDVERLRWILRQQRENFLPLKVIKGRLSEHGDASELADLEPDEEQLSWETAALAAAAAPAAAVPAAPVPVASMAGPPETPAPEVPPAPEPEPPEPEPLAPEPPAPEPPVPEPPVPEPPVPEPSPEPMPAPPEPVVSSRRRSSAPPASGSLAAPVAPPDGSEVDSYTDAELARAAGVEVEMVKELQSFGLLQPQSGAGGSTFYDRDALQVVGVASAFARHGVEARHLRAWKTSADREASLFEQVIMPLMHQRNPQSRQQAFDTLDELGAFGAELRRLLLRQALRAVR